MQRAAEPVILLAISLVFAYSSACHDRLEHPVKALLALCLLASSVLLILRAARALLRDLGGGEASRLPGRRPEWRDVFIDIVMLAFGLAGFAASMWLLVRD